METNMSLMGLMMVNRHRFIGHQIPIVVPIIPPDTIETPIAPIVIPQPIISGYVLEDFGENAINNHSPSDASHSARCQLYFNYITKDFRDRCTSYESYKTPILVNTYVWNELDACKKVKADIIFIPYVNAAVSSNTENDNFILTVGSHYDNDGGNYQDVQVGSDNNRHDITANANTFLSNSIAVSARRDTPELFKNSTSEGYGMEFFEDCSPEALNPYYPDKDVLEAFAELYTSDGVNLISTANPGFGNKAEVGGEIILKYTQDESTWKTTTITEIVNESHIRVSPAVPLISSPNVYGWKYMTIGETLWGQAESWAVPIVAGKLKVIKMTTNSDWDTVRVAARATAKRNITGIVEIDNVNWDIYRGFGCIDVQAAIEFINTNN